jgi:iron complex outermembrane recepter protein
MSANPSRSVSYLVRAALVLGAVALMGSTARVSAADSASASSGDSATSSQATEPGQHLVAQTSTPGPLATAGKSTAVSQLQEVTVTGTRIRRPGLQSSSPLVNITSTQIEQRASVNLESFLNQLPNYNPAATPVTNNLDVQPSAFDTPGISTISLRGLGANRSLVLINGHRAVPINADMAVDINGIPAAMIESIQTITGGASAVYGADAMGGVTNFILKQNFEGAQFDVQDGETQAGDGNELEASALVGANFASDKGNITIDLEYYNRDASYQRNRSYYTNEWTDPNAPQSTSNALFGQTGYNGITMGIAEPPSNAALGVLFPNRPVGASGCATGAPTTPLVFGYGSCGSFQIATINFMPGGALWTADGPLSTSNYTGPTSTGGYGLANSYDATYPNTPGSPPPEVQTLKFNNPLAYVESPQTRYSFYMNGHYNITDDIQFYATARYAQSRTATILPTPTTAFFGWEANVPYNATTDSPINPALITALTPQATLQTIYNAFKANPTSSNPYWNPGFIGPGQKNAQHPVPWQLALALDSRGFAPGGVPPVAAFGPLFGGPPSCFTEISASSCSSAPTSWQLSYLPMYGAPQRATNDLTQSWQIETGFKFPLDIADWTADLYYSRGESFAYDQGLGNDSLQRFRALIQSPDYGMGQSFQGNANGANANFGTSVPSNCSSGFYNSIFGGDVAPSADCQSAIDVTLQSVTQVQQDIVEADFNGSLFKLPAGAISAALGFQYRRLAASFQPDELQSTSSFLDQTIGLYPQAGLTQPEIANRDGYAELFIPILKNMGVKNLSLDIGGRYSSFDHTPNATTFKVTLTSQVTSWLRARGGFNRATRSPDLAELYIGEQEYFGGGPQYGDPCSVRSRAPFGAGGAAPDMSPSAGIGATKLASGQTAAGAASTYLICAAQMGGVGSPTWNAYYTTQNQETNAGGAVFAWLNEEGNPNLRAETADTWTAGLVFSDLGHGPLLEGLSGSIDWWQYNIKNAIELESPDYASYLCYGSTTVTNAAEAAAQAATPACQNVGRLISDGTAATTLLQYTNSATIGIQGIDIGVNWIAQLADLGLTRVPGAIAFNTQDSILDYYRTKSSPASFDVNVNWKDSLGPNLAGTNAGAFGYRLNATISYILPSFSVNLHWIFLPSVNTANKAFQQAIIAHNSEVASSGKGTMLSYTPNTDLAAPAWYVFDLSASYTVNHWLQIRGGIQNLLGWDPPQLNATAGFPVGTNLSAVCSTAAAQQGCVNPGAYSLPSDGGALAAGPTSIGFYEEGIIGRTFFLGLKATF